MLKAPSVQMEEFTNSIGFDTSKVQQAILKEFLAKIITLHLNSLRTLKLSFITALKNMAHHTQADLYLIVFFASSAC